MRTSMQWSARACLGVLLLQAASLYAAPPARGPAKDDPNWGPGVLVLVPPQTTKVHILLIFDTNADELTKILALNKDQLQGVIKDDLKPDNYDLTVMEGADVTADNILRYYRDLSVGPTESVFCYYAGHGGFDDNVGLFFDLKAKGTGSLVRSRLLDAMKAKNGRLTALVTDCCANTSTIKPPPPAPATEPGPPVGDMKWLSHWVKELLLRNTGVVDINSCDSKTRQRSFAVLIPSDDGKSVTKGGLFTDNLVSIWRQPLCLSSTVKEVTWQAFYDKVKQGTQQDFKTLLKGDPDASTDPAVRGQADQTPEALRLDSRIDEVKIDQEKSGHWRLGLRVLNNNGDGLRVGEVVAGSAAEKIGFEVGDVLLSMDGKTLQRESDYTAGIDAATTGHVKIVLRDVRNKKVMTLPDVTLELMQK